MKNLKTNQKGFTIIEVMIVLVIAAVILLIVFLAVPALQRNSRNTTLKNDVAALLATVSEFQNNNNGAMPTGVSQSGQDVTLSGATGTSSVVAKVSGGTTVALGTGTTMPTATGTVHLFYNRKCNGNAISTTTTNRAVAAGYQVEGGSGNVAQCQES